MSELIKRSEDWLDYHKGAPWETDAMKLIAELVKRVKELEQQLQQAHRQGWEQGRREAFIIGYEQGHNDTVESCYGSIEDKAADAIAAMEYGGKANEIL